MAKKKINPLDIIAAKQAKIKEVNQAAAKRVEQLKETTKKESKPVVTAKPKPVAKKSTKKKADKNGGNKLIRVHNEIHEHAKFNTKRMALSDYVESLIDLAEEDSNIKWKDLKPFETTPHSLEKKRTLFRVSPHHHKKAKFNFKRMKLQEYIETLVMLDRQGFIKW